MKALIVAACLLALGGPGLAQIAGGERAAPPPAADPELPASDLLVRYESPDLRFRWALAPEASLEPALVRDLRTAALADRERAIREAGQRSEFDGRKLQYEWIERWEPKAETDLLLVLTAQQYSFTGGAHGNMLLKSVLWDRGENRRVGFAELAADSTAMLAALRPEFCKALDVERRSRRGGTLGELFADCPDPAAYPIVPVGEGRINTILVQVPPYEAGPWSEGVYEIYLPVSVVQPFLLPRYRLTFTTP